MSTSPSPTTTTFRIDGMTCDHCVRAVTDALSGLDGADTVAVDLAAGTASVAGPRAVDPSAAAAAVRDAGYELRPS